MSEINLAVGKRSSYHRRSSKRMLGEVLLVTQPHERRRWT